MPRQRMYSSNAERQAAYRARLTARQALAGSGQLTARLAELETALAAMTKRAEQADARAARAERQAATARDRYAELLSTRPNRLAGAPRWAQTRVQDQLAATTQRIAELEATIDGLRAQLAAAETPSTPPGGPTPNRAARRAAERDRRRHRQ